MRLVLVVLVCACSSSHHADVDAPAGGDAALDGTAAGCEIAANLGTVTNVAFVDALFFSGGGGGGGPTGYEIDNKLTNDPVYDVISLEMYKHGAFAAGFPTTFPVTIEIKGAELDLATCGVCVRGFGDAMGTQWKGEYFATSGSVTLTAVSKTKLAGTLQNVTLVHVREGEVHSIPLNDGCMTVVGELAFDAAPTMGVAARPHMPTSVLGVSL